MANIMFEETFLIGKLFPNQHGDLEQQALRVSLVSNDAGQLDALGAAIEFGGYSDEGFEEWWTWNVNGADEFYTVLGEALQKIKQQIDKHLGEQTAGAGQESE